jgi:hypothetical protein
MPSPRRPGRCPWQCACSTWIFGQARHIRDSGQHPRSNRASDSPLGFSKWTMVLSSLKMLTCRGHGDGGPGVSGAGARTSKTFALSSVPVLSPHLLDAGDVRDAEALEGALQALVVHGRGLVRRLGLPADGALAADAGLRRERGRAEKERVRPMSGGPVKWEARARISPPPGPCTHVRGELLLQLVAAGRRGCGGGWGGVSAAPEGRDPSQSVGGRPEIDQGPLPARPRGRRARRGPPSFGDDAPRLLDCISHLEGLRRGDAKEF